MNKKIRFSITASRTIENYFTNKCERCIVLNSITKSSLKEFGLEKNKRQRGSGVAAAAGIRWENTVLEKELIPSGHCEYEKTAVDYGKYTAGQTKDKLCECAAKTAKDHETRYIYQGMLTATDSFRKKYFGALEPEWADCVDVGIAETYPDIIQLTWDPQRGKVVASIADIKLASEMQLTHKTQLTLYVRLLTCMFEEYHAAGLLKEAVAETEKAYLWNRSKGTGDDDDLCIDGHIVRKEVNEFDVNAASVLLDEFFEKALPAAVRKVYDSVKSGKRNELAESLELCVSQRCEWCNNLHQCRNALRQKGSIALLPYLSGYAQEHARAVGAPDTAAELLNEIGQNDTLRKKLGGNRSWENILRDTTELEVHRDTCPYSFDKMSSTAGDIKYRWRKNARSFSMPSGQDVALVLTAQKDVATGRVYALAYMRKQWDKEKKAYRSDVKVYLTERPTQASYLENASDLVNDLWEELADTAKKKLTMQAYVMDPYERMNLDDLLYDLIDNDDKITEDILSKAMRLLLWLQGDRIVTDAVAQPDKTVDHPVVVLVNEIRRLLILPIPIAYDMMSVRNALNAYVKDLIKKDEADKFFDEMSDAMKPDAIHYVWNDLKPHSKKDDIDDEEEDEEEQTFTTEAIREHIEKRLDYAWAIMHTIQSAGWDSKKNKHIALLNYASVPELPRENLLRPTILSKWAFENKNEVLLSYHKIRQARMQELSDALNEGSIVKAELVGMHTEQRGEYTNTVWTLRPEELGDYRIFRWFSALIVEENVFEALYTFNDYTHRNSWGLLCDLSNLKTVSENGRLLLEWTLFRPSYDFRRLYNTPPAPGQPILGMHKTFYICEKFTDINSGKTASVLEEIGKNDSMPLPERLYGPTGESFEGSKDRLLALSGMDGHNFTRSQLTAFRHLWENRLTVLQGPPGTGKTDFIARAVITMCKFCQSARNEKLRVLISANSHPAIENALKGILKKLGTNENIKVCKADRLDNYEPELRVNGHILKPYSEDDIVKHYLNEPRVPVVVGATNWSCHKIRNAFEDTNGSFDLIIIDEASQVKVMDAMLCLKCSNESTRFLLVGDDDQLPPIIYGKYKKEPGMPYDYGSVFRYYRDHCGNMDYNLMLSENFRMNDMLARYSADKIYGSDYRAANSEIAKRHLEYTNIPENIEEWARYILDDLQYNEEDYWPLVFCRISGGTADEQENAERRMVAELTRCLRTAIGGDCSDYDFWHDSTNSDGRFGIISPHHKHIEMLKGDISALTGMNRGDLFIDTVDKLQGQERAAVIVSYGVTDIEQAAVEGEFIFSRNRLNVSLTRGKCKTIVFFSEVLTNCPMEVYMTDDEDIRKGADFVCGLYDFMKSEEPGTCTASRDFPISGSVRAEIIRKRISN